MRINRPIDPKRIGDARVKALLWIHYGSITYGAELDERKVVIYTADVNTWMKGKSLFELVPFLKGKSATVYWSDENKRELIMEKGKWKLNSGKQ